MTDGNRVDIDYSKLTRDLKELASTTETEGRRVAQTEAARTAASIRARTPVHTGALASTIEVVSDGDGFGVTYGGGLRYAFPVAANTGNLSGSISETEASFMTAMDTMTARAVSRV